jgi:hypothetical protein
MSDDTPRTGIDRRSALKKAAAAGAIAWTAPTILSQTAHAVDFINGSTCTAKCAPPTGVTVTGTITYIGCAQDIPPGQQPVRASITQISTTAGCPCGGAVVEVIAPPQTVEVRPRPGNVNQGVFDFIVEIRCADRSGDVISRQCVGTSITANKPGSCQGAAGTTSDFAGLTSCDPPTCVAPAP